MQLLLKRGVDIDENNSLQNETSLELTIDSRNIDSVLHLIENGANIDVVDRFGIPTSVKAIELAERLEEETLEHFSYLNANQNFKDIEYDYTCKHISSFL